MTRILYWNINNFSQPKIRATRPPIAVHESASRLAYMLDYVLRGPNEEIPDLIVLVEAHSRIREVTAEGTVLDPQRTVGAAVLDLLGAIRGHPVLSAGTNWCVVPLINLGLLGQREAVAVFYNATTLQFTGPNLCYKIYPHSSLVQSQPVAPGTRFRLINYPPKWTAAMPALGRATIFPDAPAPIPENQLAGEWQYYAGARLRANRIKFPYNGCRGPFQTRFREVVGGRTLNIYSVHTSPGSEQRAVRNMQNVPGIAAVAANTVNVVLGDFNVDTFTDAAVYDGFLALPDPYRLALDPRAAAGGPVMPARKPYCMTHLLPTLSATPYNAVGVPADPQHNVYPRFGYMGSSWPALGNVGAIDNVLTAYGAGAGGPAAFVTVVNTLTGTPYSAFPAPAGAGVTPELTGGRTFASSLVSPPNILMSVPPASAGIGGIALATPGAALWELFFQHWHNFGKVRSTSDHLPLMIEV